MSIEYYWDPSSAAQSGSSSGKKIAAVAIILMLFIASGVIVLFNLFPSVLPLGSKGDVRVAVVDSGLDVDLTTSGRVGPQQSFVSTVYGYKNNEPSTTDSNPDDGAGSQVRHGTIVTQTILQNSNNVEIVVAKVIDSEGFATASGVVAAILWAIEQNSSIINLSLGSGPTFGDPLKEAVEYAFSRGVVVVSAAGNDGMGGVAGSSISSPSIYPSVISVGALDEDDSSADYSSWGPTAGRYMKPDISAEGFARTSNAIYYGTSFASPKVASIVADLIYYCMDNNIPYTPGLIQAALYAGADSLPYPAYIVGAGKASLAGAIQILNGAPTINDLPLITYIHPVSLPLDFERLFQGDNYTFNINLITSGISTYNVTIEGFDNNLIQIPETILVNQSQLIPIFIQVPSIGTNLIDGEILFDAGLHNGTLAIDISPTESIAKIAFDTSHTPWSIDTVYGQFKELYIALTEYDISVTEISNRSRITTEYLSNFDAVFVLDPCAWGTDESNYNDPADFSIPYTLEEIEAYKNYYFGGGGIFVSTLDNESVNNTAVNEFLEWSGISLEPDRLSMAGDPISVTDMIVHPITTGVQSFSFVGAAVTFNSSAKGIAAYNGWDMIAVMEGNSTGRLVVTGTNFFIDNWGIRGLYGTSSDRVIAIKIALWLIGNI